MSASTRSLKTVETTTEGMIFFPVAAHFLHSRHVLTMSGQRSITFVGRPADLNIFCKVVTGQCHQRRCNLRNSRWTTASSADRSALKLMVRLNRVQSPVVALPVEASAVVVRLRVCGMSVEDEAVLDAAGATSVLGKAPVAASTSSSFKPKSVPSGN